MFDSSRAGYHTMLLMTWQILEMMQSSACKTLMHVLMKLEKVTSRV